MDNWGFSSLTETYIEMLFNRQISCTVFLSLTFYTYVIADSGNCDTIAIYSKNYTETNPNLLIATFVKMHTHDADILKCLIYIPAHLEFSNK